MIEGVRDEDGARRLSGQMAMMFADYGFPRMAARVLMTLMTAEERSLTAGELAQRLSVSPAAISGAVRFLLQIRMAEREQVPGDRREHYRVPDDTWYQASTFKFEVLLRIRDIAALAVDALGGPDTAAGARMADMRDFYDFIESETQEMMRRWRSRPR